MTLPLRDDDLVADEATTREATTREEIRSSRAK
jgi:hypothetical protein